MGFPPIIYLVSYSYVRTRDKNSGKTGDKNSDKNVADSITVTSGGKIGMIMNSYIDIAGG